MNSNLRRTCSVVVVLVVVLAGALVQPFGGNATARRMVRARCKGRWRVQVTPINCQTALRSYPFLFCSGFVRSRRHAHRSSERRSVPARPSDTRPRRLEPHPG